MRDVGRDAADHAVDLRRRALVEGREAQPGRLAEAQLVDVLRRHLASTARTSASGTISITGFAGGDDAADRVHGELMDDAVLRRADVDALELVLGRDLALDELADLGRRSRAAPSPPRCERSWSICRICSSISVILPRDWAIARSTARARRQPRGSRSSAISRLICTRFLLQSSRTPSSSRRIRSISSRLGAFCSAR